MKFRALANSETAPDKLRQRLARMKPWVADFLLFGAAFAETVTSPLRFCVQCPSVSGYLMQVLSGLRFRSAMGRQAGEPSLLFGEPECSPACLQSPMMVVIHNSPLSNF
jgi:hypothetical protein